MCTLEQGFVTFGTEHSVWALISHSCAIPHALPAYYNTRPGCHLVVNSTLHYPGIHSVWAVDFFIVPFSFGILALPANYNTPLLCPFMVKTNTRVCVGHGRVVLWLNCLPWGFLKQKESRFPFLLDLPSPS